MAWQGVPFRVPFDVNEYITVALNSLPKITVESSTDYWGIALTAGAALVGGIIPAWIARRTFKENSYLLKSERKEQQGFLAEERAQQQTFLTNERIENSKHLDEDRQTQLEIAKKNFNMQVLSANRQAWINDLRSTASEFLSLMNVCMMENYDARWSEAEYDRCRQLLKDNEIAVPEKKLQKFDVDYLYKQLDKHESEINNLHAKLDSTRSRISFLENKINLLLNPSERLSRLIINRIAILRKLVWHVSDSDLNTKRELKKNISCMEGKLVKNMQKCLKKEWDRVKDGV
ncbi:TPA: hypothetical protein NKO55_000288 [Enterobacter asburiae]|uniref:hypothetical protein n=1 Tax=Enterobacter kobei TaxID=208224 RepID=UPI001A150A31|nr:hypothetical protein [Enterobacter kobei]EKY1591250.1 hypothetical protein [Enterobacter kobei]MCK7182642.1 hypothetical protein [Enterobacter kobei]HCH0655764.1 hypothetical protein [Enterobacter asburiae]